MSRRHVLMLLLLAAIWGSSFMFIKVGVRELEPSTLVFVRLLLSALTLLALVPFRMSLSELVGHIRASLFPFVILALLNAALPFWLLSWAETRIDSGFAALLQASAPIFVAVLAYFFFRDERVSGLRLVGVIVGFAGIALLVGVTPEGSILAALAVLGTALCYAGSALHAGRHLQGVPPLAVAFGTTLLATLATAPAGIAQMPGELPGWKVIGSVLALGIVGLGLAYVLYFELIAGAGASRAMLVTYLVPPIAVVYGALILDEPITASAIAGMTLVLAGVALGTGNVRGVGRRRVDTLPT